MQEHAETRIEKKETDESGPCLIIAKTKKQIESFLHAFTGITEMAVDS